jgi:cytoskeletal protein CcmA (bactofilin family)
MAPKGPPSQDRGIRPDREALEAAFSGDLAEPADSASRVPNAYSSERPTFSTSTSAGLASSGPTPADKCANVIAAGAKWNGTLTVEDSVRVDGIFAGEIDTKGTVHVAEGAQVDAKLRAGYVVISGEFRGEIRCEQRVDLMPRSRVNGEVITKVLSVHEGATLDGSVNMSGGIDIDSRRTSRLARNGTEERGVAAAAARPAQDEI